MTSHSVEEIDENTWMFVICLVSLQGNDRFVYPYPVLQKQMYLLRILLHNGGADETGIRGCRLS